MLVTVYQLTWSNNPQHWKLQQHTEITCTELRILHIIFQRAVFTQLSFCHYFVLSVQQSSFYGYTSMLPSRYTQAVMAGESKCRATCNDKWRSPSPLPLVIDKFPVIFHRNWRVLWQQLYSLQGWQSFAYRSTWTGPGGGTQTWQKLSHWSCYRDEKDILSVSLELR